MARVGKKPKAVWAPIETAPRDEYVIITDGAVLPDIVCWHNEQPAHGAFLARPEGWFAASGRSRIMAPTHWMPVPEQPIRHPAAPEVKP